MKFSFGIAGLLLLILPARAHAFDTGSPDSVAPPVAPPPSADTEHGITPKEDNTRRGLLGPVRFGPLIGSGLPSILNFGLTLRFGRYLGAGLDAGLIPTLHVANYGSATLSYNEYDVYGRVYPFGGGFFIGSGLGYETASASYTTSVNTQQAVALGYPSSVDYTGDASVRTLILIPQIGYLHTFDSGFSVGIDLGLQLPIASSNVQFSRSTSVSLPQAVVDQYLAPNEKAELDTLQSVSRTPLPAFGFRLGWLL